MNLLSGFEPVPVINSNLSHNLVDPCDNEQYTLPGSTARKTNTMNTGQLNKKDASRLVLTQFYWVLVLFPFINVFWDKPIAISATLGGFISLVPNLFLYRCHFTYSGANQAKKILNGFYLGEFGKVIITAILLSIFYNVPGLIPQALLLGFVFTQLFFWCAPFLVMILFPKIKLLVS